MQVQIISNITIQNKIFKCIYKLFLILLFKIKYSNVCTNLTTLFTINNSASTNYF